MNRVNTMLALIIATVFSRLKFIYPSFLPGADHGPGTIALQTFPAWFRNCGWLAVACMILAPARGALGQASGSSSSIGLKRGSVCREL